MNILPTKISVLTLILAFSFGSQTIQNNKTVSNDEKELISHPSLTTSFPEIPAIDAIFPGYDDLEEEAAPQLEAWMFEDVDYEEAEPELEAWMFEDVDYEEAEPELEAWMFEDMAGSVLELEAEPELEAWMFDTDYFNDTVTFEDTVALEDWMFDAEYFNN